MIYLALLIPFAYLLGSVPFGLLIARFHGIDLRKVGSGNIGATNVARALGKKWAYACFALDCLKALLPMILARVFIDQLTVPFLSLWIMVGCAAVLGHVFPVFLRFRGGKGAATSMGVVLGLYPYLTIPGIIAFIIWAAVLLISRYVSLASIVAAVAFPVVLTVEICLHDHWRFADLWPLLIVAVLIPALVVVRHVENIKRLLEGSESKAFQRRPT
jgi:glycerol-3-phosphate acyltransferase PlsY